jgi:hypothetical protein
LLNYRGGSFLLPDAPEIRKECQIRGVSFEILSDFRSQPNFRRNFDLHLQNMETVVLEKAPKIAVYTPKGKQPWDDAVTMVLTYAEIPFTPIYDEEVLSDQLILYDWLHLHHEDFTGQYGKFLVLIEMRLGILNKKRRRSFGCQIRFCKSSQEKLAVAKKIRDFVIGGGFMFAMCSATDSFDIALSAEGVDICEPMFDGDNSEANYQSKIDYSKTFAFKDFILERRPEKYEFSDIDMTEKTTNSNGERLFHFNGFLSKMGCNSKYVVSKSYAIGQRFYGTNYCF